MTLGVSSSAFVKKDGVWTGEVSDDDDEFLIELVQNAGPRVAKRGVIHLIGERDLLICMLHWYGGVLGI